MPISTNRLCLKIVDQLEPSETSARTRALLEHQLRKAAEVEAVTAWRIRFRSAASDVVVGLDWMDDEDGQESHTFIQNTMDTLAQYLDNRILSMDHDARLDLCHKLKTLSSFIAEAPPGGDVEAGGMPVLRYLLPTLFVITEGMSDKHTVPLLLHIQQIIATLLLYDDIQLEAGTWSRLKMDLDSGMKSPNRSVRLASG
jgi:hypothetical protein